MGRGRLRSMKREGGEDASVLRSRTATCCPSWGQMFSLALACPAPHTGQLSVRAVPQRGQQTDTVSCGLRQGDLVWTYLGRAAARTRALRLFKRVGRDSCGPRPSVNGFKIPSSTAYRRRFLSGLSHRHQRTTEVNCTKVREDSLRHFKPGTARRLYR